LILARSKHLSAKSLVVLPSLSGTTKESLAFLEFAKAKGATVLALTGHEDSPIAKEADHALVNFAEDDTSSESFYVQSLLIALAVMAERSEFENPEALLHEMELLPKALLAAKQAIEPQAEKFASHLAGNPWHIITGAGNCWPQALYYGMCILEEMQWIRTRPVHASDFFHGTLELVEKGVSIILLKGEDECRPLAERVEHFVTAHTDKLMVIDTKSFALSGLSARARGLLSPAILAAVLERVNAHLEVMTKHPLTTRRYYRRVSY
jgi:fructoselysine-6-phosphate deglycase